MDALEVIPGGPHAMEEDDDDEEEDELEEEAEDEEEEESEDDEEDFEGVLEGGVAEPVDPGKSRRMATLADITLFIVCSEQLPFCKAHPVLKVGVTVQIGVDKVAKLSAVFRRYVEFCNEQFPAAKIDIADLEFVHTQILAGHDTAESAALMKNDRIKVRPEQSEKRHKHEVRNRIQREIDREYFQQLSHLLPITTLSGRTSKSATHKYADTILACEDGNIPCPSAVVRKRCKWLGVKIDAAKVEQGRQSVVTVQDTEAIEDEDEDFEILQRNIKAEDRVERAENEESVVAAQIENDEEDVAAARYASDDDMSEDSKSDDVVETTAYNANLVWTTVNHPKIAVHLLLEYCYTNRVVSLGFEAFVQSCKTKPQHKKVQGPVPPYTLKAARWPNAGDPSIFLPEALAGIRLAEEAGKSRLSLMCEIAAVQLVNVSTFVNALTACEMQGRSTGNYLPRLRRAAMDVIVRTQHQTGGDASALLLAPLTQHGRVLVPPLLTGIVEAIDAGGKNKKKSSDKTFLETKRDWRSKSSLCFDKQLDDLDVQQREMERRRRRGAETQLLEDSFALGDEMGAWREDLAQQMSLKRMSHHLTGRMGNRVASNRRGTRRSSAGR